LHFGPVRGERRPQLCDSANEPTWEFDPCGDHVFAPVLGLQHPRSAVDLNKHGREFLGGEGHLGLRLRMSYPTLCEITKASKAASATRIHFEFVRARAAACSSRVSAHETRRTWNSEAVNWLVCISSEEQGWRPRIARGTVNPTCAIAWSWTRLVSEPFRMPLYLRSSSRIWDGIRPF